MRIIGRRKIKIHKIILVIGLLLISVGFSVLWYIFQIQHNKTSNTIKTKATPSIRKVVQKQDQIVHIVAMGDMLAHDTIIANAKDGDSYNFGKYFSNIRSSYKNADVIFCDQEGLSSGEQYGISGYPSFNAPTQFSSGLQSGAGCNMINLANNHIGDKGVNATNATIDVWNNLKPFAVSGANKSADDQKKVSYATVNGIKIGFVAFADFNNNKSTPDYSVNNYHNETLVRQLVAEARANADVVMVSMHWGVEDSNDVSADQETQANLLSSLGTDIIIGTGPHVLQRAQTITRTDGGKTIVWYSLGNMLSSQLNIKELIGGIAGVDITKKDNKITVGNLSFIPTYMHYEWTASEEASGDLLARKNAMIYLLKDAADPLSKSLFNTTVATQEEYVTATLGSQVIIK